MKHTNEEIRVAILKSIGKWKAILKGNKGDKGASNCALCSLFNTIELNENNEECLECPVYLMRGRKYCEDTPHEDWIDHQARHKDNYVISKGRYILCETCKTLAWNEIVFLREVLDNWKKVNGIEKPCKCCQSNRIVTIRS